MYDRLLVEVRVILVVEKRWQDIIFCEAFGSALGLIQPSVQCTPGVTSQGDKSART
jgi:hypothetical protein